MFGLRSRLSALSLAALAAMPAVVTHAADKLWTGGTASYTNAANWGGTVPGAADKAINDNGAGNVVQINAGNPDWLVNGIQAGFSTGNGAFVQNAQTVNLTNTTGRGAVRLGVVPGRSGAYTINGGALNYSGEFNVGERGTATLNVNGGAITGNGNLAINVGSSLDTVTSTMGGTNKSDYTWFEQGFYLPDSSRGIPPAGSTFSSETLADHSYTMPANYAANNAVQVFAGITNATITFTTPTAATALSFLGSSGFGTSTVNYTVHHADSSTETGTIAVLDWFDNAGTVAYRPGGRISANGLDLQIINDGPNKPYLLSFDVTLANTTSPVTSVDLVHNGGGGVAAFLAVSSSTGGAFTPQAITGYNQDIIVEVAAPIYVASTVTNVLNQTAGTINITGELFVGNYGAGVYNFSGGTNNFQNWFGIGRAGGNGIVNMTGGELNKTGNGNLLIGTGYQAPTGSTPSGTINQSAGTINCSGEFMIPENAPAVGFYNLSGTGVLNVNSWMQVGRSGGAGLMNMSGGTVNKTGGGNFIVADNATGVLNQTGGAIGVSSEVWVGQAGSGNGTYNLSGGSITNHNWFAIGRQGATGVVNFTNGVIARVDGGNFAIGSGGSGTLNQYGGILDNTPNAGSITYVAEAGGTGIWNMYGGAATLNLLQFCQGGNGAGVLSLNGGVISASEVSCGLDGANGTLYFNGGTLRAAADNVNFFHGLGAAYVQAGGAVIDSQGFNVTASQVLTDNGGGGLTKLGAGVLTLTGANSYTGPTLVNAGTLAVRTDSTANGDYSVASGAKLSVAVQSLNGQLNAANATFASGSPALTLDLGAFGNPVSAPLNVVGTLAVNGTVTVNIADSLPQLGQFPLIQYGARSGSGSFVLGAIPVGIVANIVTNGNTIALNITTVNLPRWDGQAGGNWDIGLTTNWVNIGDSLPTFYGQGNAVEFNDSALGTTTVNLTTTVNPSKVLINNSSLAYTLNGTGKISGSAGLTKQGSAVATIANTGGNNFTGPTVISGGTLSVNSLANGGSASSIGASSANATNLVLAGGTLSYTGPAVAINRSYSVQTGGGTIDTVGNLAVSGLATAASGAGFTKTGAGQLAYTGVGSNYLSGTDYLVRDGAVVMDGSAGAQTNKVQGAFSVAGVANAVAILTNTTLNVNDNTIGNVAGSVGAMTVNTNTTLNVNSWFLLGDAANSVSSFTLNGGTVNVPNGRLFLCSAPGTTATLNINSGVINKNSGDIVCISDGGWNGSGARTGTVNQFGGTFTIAPEVQIGQTATSTGIYNLHGGALTSTGWFVIGRSGGNGTFNMDGGVLTHTSGGQPAFIVGSGAGNNSVTSVGVMNHSGGTINCTSEYWVAENSLVVGTNNMSGTAVLNLANWMSIGRRGLGEFNMSGGTINKTGGGNFIIGDGGTGYFNLTGGTISLNSEFWVGQGGGGSGLFNMSGGTVTVNSWVAVGRGGAGSGTWNMSGGSFTKNGNSGNHFILGSGGGLGTLNQTGGTITSVLSDTWIGENSDGIWNQSGGNTILSVLHIAQNGGRVASYNLSSTGTLTVGEITTGNASSSSTLNVDGGTIKADTGANANFLHGLTAANIQTGGVTIDSGTNTIGISQSLLAGTGSGGLNKTGNGTLYLNGVNTYTGTTLVSQGALGGTGTIAGPVSVAAGATFAPGASIGTLTINNTLGLAAGSSTVMELSKNASTNDVVTGVTTLTYGGTLVLKNLGGMLAVNDTFKLFNAATYGGSFSSVVSQTPGQTVTWDTSNLAVNGTVRVASVVANPVTLTPVASGGTLNLSWPQLGYRLEVQTNSLAVGINTNWVTVPGSTGVTSVSVPVVSGNPTVFFRLVFP